jgi:hypothetical protein
MVPVGRCRGAKVNNVDRQSLAIKYLRVIDVLRVSPVL